MDELLAGRLTFKVKNSQGNIVDGTVVQYQSSDYYVQADGSLLWQVQAIENSSNTVILSPSQTIQTGFTLTDVIVNNLPVQFGYCKSNEKAYLAVKMSDGTLRVLSYENKLPYGEITLNPSSEEYLGDFEFSPSPYTLGDHFEFVNNDNIGAAPYSVLPCSMGDGVIIVGNKQFDNGVSTGDESPLSIFGQLNQ